MSLSVPREFPWLINEEKLKETPRLPDKGLCQYCNMLDFEYLFKNVLGESSFKWNGKESRLTHGRIT